MAKKYYDHPARKEVITHTCVFYAKWYARFILKYPLLHEMMEKRTNIYKKKGYRIRTHFVKETDTFGYIVV